MKFAVLIAALVCASPAVADTAKVFGGARAKTLTTAENSRIVGKGVNPQLAPLASLNGGPLPRLGSFAGPRPQLSGSMPMSGHIPMMPMGPLAPRL